jgi:hypothetical protein
MSIAKISPIKKEYSNAFHTFESSLAKAGFYRAPGTSRILFPYKEMSGRYRTGLDENASYLFNLPDEERKAEIKRIKETKARLEQKTGFDLNSNSKYYNYSSDLPDEQKISPVKLTNQDKFFDLSNPIDEITWNWVRVHPMIAPSLEAYKQGKVHPDMVQYYIVNEELEERSKFSKKQEINKAIVQLDNMTIPKRRKIARLMGLPVSDNTKEEIVYNLLDSALKDGEFKDGEYKGMSTIHLFNDLLKMTEERINVKDVVEQSITHGIYRIKKGGAVYEGEMEISPSKEELVNHLIDPLNQEELIALEKRLNIKKII